MSDLEPYEEKNVASRMRRCVHFNGLLYLPLTDNRDHKTKACDAGVVYETVMVPPSRGIGSIPCFTDEAAKSGATCAHAKFMTREEAIADWLKDKAYIRAWSEAIQRGECPTCKKPVTMRQVGACVYGSCGHRLYQGTLPKAKE